MTDKEWNNFGYNSNEPCDICGNTDTKLEPRFYYATCREHANVSPVRREDYANKSKTKQTV